MIISATMPLLCDTYFMLFFIGFIDMLRKIYRNKVMQEKYELHFSKVLNT